ncbi:MAG: hypothetical protein LAT57_04205, partial [Balneolales bacterium]|nr:hypothetical protein [Balneolales bacterium]
MKKLIFTALLGVGLLFAGNAYSQNAIIGDGFAGGWDINNEAEWRFFSQGVEETRIRITHANAAGNQFFRLVRGFRTDPESRKTQFQPASGLDTEYAIGSKIAPSTGKTGKFFINVSDVNNNYVFKTPAAGVNDGDARFVVFEVQGEIREVTDLTRSSSTVYRSQEIGITATTDGSLSAGQAVYLRYSSDDFATSTIVEMTGSGSTYNSVIPSSANTSGANISYYAFTSGTGLIIPNADADLFSINRLMDASYSYNVQDTYVTAQAGNWSNGNTWAAGSVPP